MCWSFRLSLYLTPLKIAVLLLAYMYLIVYLYICIFIPGINKSRKPSGSENKFMTVIRGKTVPAKGGN